LRKFATENSDLLFPRTYIINHNIEIQLSVFCILTPFTEISKLRFWERIAVNIVYAVLL